MHEDFLHFIWKYQYFDRQDLRTTDRRSLSIIQVGSYNALNAGADFSYARVLIDGTEWAGNVEIHWQSSDWQRHHHHADAAYNAVVLHVVWEDDAPVKRADGTPIPTLALAERVHCDWFARYNVLRTAQTPIPCAAQLAQVSSLTKLQMLDKALTRRLERKAEAVLALLAHNQQDWEETAYQWLVQSFGFKVNQEACARLANVLPYKVIRKHADQILQIEALLLGQAGFLTQPEAHDDYTLAVQAEYRFLSQKYSLGAALPPSVWKFSRLRPQNFPTVRLAQLAAVLATQPNLFSWLIHQSAELLRQGLSAPLSDYWRQHYHLAKRGKSSTAVLGKDAANNLLINTLAPLLAAYSQAIDNVEYIQRAVQLLESLPAEQNQILEMWQGLGWRVRTALDSQALIELYNEYCSQKRCLDCTIGSACVRSSSA